MLFLDVLEIFKPQAHLPDDVLYLLVGEGLAVLLSVAVECLKGHSLSLKHQIILFVLATVLVALLAIDRVQFLHAGRFKFLPFLEGSLELTDLLLVGEGDTNQLVLLVGVVVLEQHWLTGIVVLDD